MTVPDLSTREGREQLRALADAATEGPWVAEYSGEQGNCVLPPDSRSTREALAVTRLYRAQADAELIAAARTAVPALLDALDAAVAEVSRLRTVVFDWQRNAGAARDGALTLAREAQDAAALAEDGEA